MVLNICKICTQKDIITGSGQFMDDINTLTNQISNLFPEIISVQSDENSIFQENVCFFCKQELIRICKFISLLEQSDALSKYSLNLYLPELDSLEEKKDKELLKRNINVEEIHDFVNLDVKKEFPIRELQHLQENRERRVVYEQSSEPLHRKIIHKNENWECQTDDFECEESTVSSETVIKSESHTAGKKQADITCDVCMERFTKIGYLEQHMRVHTGEKPFKCDICEKGFTRKESVKVHILIHTGEKPYECDICTKRFTLRTSLRNHTLTHTGNKPYKCDTCSKCFTQKKNLIEHAMNHTNDKPFKCHICLQGFTAKSKLNQHLKVYGDKPSHKPPKRGKQRNSDDPFSCNVCAKIFLQKHRLKEHMLSHTDERSFQCNLCPKRFKQKSHLKSHMCLHTGEKPFSCDLCSRKFTQKPHLKAHKCEKIKPIFVKVEDQTV